MLTRYGTNADGSQKKLADIYTLTEHALSRNSIDSNALYITKRLSSAGFAAYIVGGAVRDLLLGKKPKDFDIVTDAFPRKIRRLFANSRIIGRRFRLVHVRTQGQIIEVSTFRATRGASNNYFGTITEDVQRRDFTMNALYYDPREEYIIDYVGGFRDIKAGRIRALVPVDKSFAEDPVRMVRAVRYEASAGLRASGKIVKGIKKHSYALKQCPISRLTEEIFKVLESGSNVQFFSRAISLGMFGYLMPEIGRLTASSEYLYDQLISSLNELDRMILENGKTERSKMILSLCKPFIRLDDPTLSDNGNLSKGIFLRIKSLFQPLTPPNTEVEKAVRYILNKEQSGN